MSVNGTLVEDKMCRFKGEWHILASRSVSFTLTTVQVPNLALTRTKRITEYAPNSFVCFIAVYRFLIVLKCLEYYHSRKCAKNIERNPRKHHRVFVLYDTDQMAPEYD